MRTRQRTRSSTAGSRAVLASLHRAPKPKPQVAASKRSRRPQPAPPSISAAEFNEARVQLMLALAAPVTDGAVFDAEIAELERRTGREVLLLRVVQGCHECRELTLAQLRTLPKVCVTRKAYKLFEDFLEEMDAMSQGEGSEFPGDDTFNSTYGQDFIRRHIGVVNGLMTRKQYPAAYNHAIALLAASVRRDFWFMDTEMEDDVKWIRHALQQQWVRLYEHFHEAGILAADIPTIQAVLNQLSEDIDEYCIINP